MIVEPVLQHRERYRPSWRVGPALPIWLAVLLAAAVVAAWLLDLLWRTGHYVVFLAPALAALALAGLMILVVTRGRVRHSLLACVLGGLVGGGMYVGHYHVGMTREIGSALGRALPWYEVRLLPAYIRWRMATTVTHHGSMPKAEAMQKAPTPGMNWFGLVFELGVCVVFVGVAGYKRARRPYAEASDAWLDRTVRSLPASALASMVAALEHRDPAELTVATAAGPATALPRLDLAIDHVKSVAGRLQPGEAYLSLKLVKAEPQGVALDRFESSKGKLIVDRVRIDARELEALLPVPGQPDAVKTPPPLLTAAAQATTRQVEDIPQADAAGVLRTKGKLAGTAVALLPALVMLGGLVLAVVGIADDVNLDPGLKATAGLAGGTLVVIGLFESLFGVADFATRRMRRLCAAAVRPRPRRLVDPDAPNARFVEVVPREKWHQVTLDNAGDVGFLVIDVKQGVLCFEGEVQRWSCPVAAITQAVIVEHVLPGGKQVVVFVVLAVRDGDGATRELPLRQRGQLGMISTGRRRRLALALHDEIGQAMRAHGGAMAE